MQNLYTAFKTVCDRRTSVREFADKPVSREDISKITQIALTSPYASGRKNWDILVVDDRVTIQILAEQVSRCSETLQKRLREDFTEPYSSYADYFSSFEGAAVLFIPCFRISPGLSYMLEDPDERILQWERDNYVKSISCVAMLILLAAESLGLGGCYMTGPLLAEKKIAATVHIKTGRQIGALIPVGYPKEGPS